MSQPSNPHGETPAPMSDPSDAVSDFMDRGFVCVPSVLDDKLMRGLRAAIDVHAGKRKGGKRHVMFKRMFEECPELALEVFRNPVVLKIVRDLLGVAGSTRGQSDGSLRAHVIHNNAFRVDPGQRGQAPSWHTDDPPIFRTTNGKPLPENIVVAPLVLTCMFFLNDLESWMDGGTRVIEGSHRFGALCTQENAARHPHMFAQCPAGSVLIISSATWHRGAPVMPEGNPRYVFQATYGRRLVGHKHGTIMDYCLPRSVTRLLKTKEDEELMGFLSGGAYS